MRAASLLIHARRSAGLTQQKLAKRAGVTQASISRIEEGKVSPRFETLERLLDACGFALELVPRAGHGVDRTAIRELLRLTPAERARIAVEEARNLDRIGR
jgi:transcriptional regulator with XRE-family HTH domain